MKKEKSPIIVILSIVFLSLFIILPPTFRALVPKELTKQNNTNGNGELVVLICNKIYSSELYRVSSRTKYINGVPSSNTINYTKIEATAETTQQNSDNKLSVNDDITYFKSIPNMNVNETDNFISVMIDKEVINNNSSEERLKKYLNDDISKQQDFYKSLGYTCNKIKS